ncbi:MAG: hypothetical protein L0K86_03610 [Actinomycetia bacterium]|nr:hypothetical protein [Actinomycetes bacterium]
METTETPVPLVRRRPRASLWVLRGLLTAHVVAVLCQPVLAGLFLTGNVDAIEVHAFVADIVYGIAAAAAVAAGVYVFRGRGRVWILPTTVLLLFVEGLQIPLGYDRQLQWHIPLGVAIVTSAVVLVIWVWGPSAGRSR